MSRDKFCYEKSLDKHKSWYKLDLEGDFITKTWPELNLPVKKYLRKSTGGREPVYTKTKSRKNAVSSMKRHSMNGYKCFVSDQVTEYHQGYEAKDARNFVDIVSVVLLFLIVLTAFAALSLYNLVANVD